MSNSRYRPLARELGVFLLFVVLSVAMTWPLARHIDRAVSDPGDPFFTTWAMDWDDYATLHRGVRLFDANIFYPSARSLAFSENMYGVALLFFPLFAAGVAPLTIHNLALLLGFAVTGYAAYALARYVTHSTEGAIVGGIAYAFLGFRFHHLPHLHFVWTPFLPLMLLSLFAFARKPDMRRSILLAAAIVMNGLNSLHWLLFGTTALAIAVAVVAVTHGVVRNRRYWAGAAFAFVLAAVTLFPFVQPYREVAHSYGMQRTAADALPNSADWRDWLTPNLQSKLYSKWARGEAVGHERTLFPGVMVLVLAVAPLFAPPRRRIAAALDVVVLLALVAALYGWMTGEVHLAFVRYRGFAAPLVVALVAIVARIVVERPSRPHLPAEFPALATWIFIGALGARGLRGWFHTFLFDFVSPFRGIRMPVRWAMIAYTALAILVALGVLRIIGGRPRVARVAIAGAIAAAMLFELRTAPIRWYLVPLDPRPVYAWLEKTPISGGVIELPIAQEVEYEYMWQATQHHKPLLNGVSSYIPAQFDRLAAEYEHVPLSPSFLDALEERRCSLVIVHAGGLARRADVRQWLATSVASGRLMFLRRFDAGSRGDYVFAVTRIERAAARWRAPETPDPAGRTPEQNAQLFIRDAAWTYNGVTFGALESPPLGTIRGRLVVLGWARSPFGLDHAVIHFANGSVSTRKEFDPRADVAQLLPWYPDPDRISFAEDYAAPPPGVRGETDMQIEIVDRRGRSTFLRPSFFRWMAKPAIACVWREDRLDALLGRIGGLALRERQRLVDGSESIRDVIDPLVGDADRESDLAFAERVVPLLVGGPADRLTRWCIESMKNGRPRERILDDIVTSREFAEANLRSGAVTVD